MPDRPCDPLITAHWLSQNLSDPDLRIVDATWLLPSDSSDQTGSELYLKAHLPGAVFFDIDEIADKQTDLPHMLPDPAQFGAQISALGLGQANRLIIYDRQNYFASARVWWMFRAMGHDQVSVLDGGLRAWQDIEGRIETGRVQLQPAEFIAQFDPELVCTLNQIKDIAEKNKAHIIDARPKGRFEGRLPEPRPGLPSGHIRGSHNIQASDLITQTGYFRTTDELKSLLGPYLDKPVISTCGSGVSAALITLALARLGHKRSALYDGSWSEWARQTDTDIQVTP